MKNENSEKIVVFRHIWREGKRKYVISIPSEVVQYYKLEGKFIKATLEVVESGDSSSENVETVLARSDL
jgi:hypothetical protein